MITRALQTSKIMIILVAYTILGAIEIHNVLMQTRRIFITEATRARYAYGWVHYVRKRKGTGA